MIGNNVRLYDMVLQFLRTLFLRTRNVHYCTLRAELLMSLHETEVQEITNVDPCHKFTWCVDACIRERNVDTKRSREIQAFLDGIKSGTEQVLGDLSMMLCDPYAVHFLATSSLKILNNLVAAEGLPREHHILLLLLRMLALGLSAWQMIDSQVQLVQYIPLICTKIYCKNERLIILGISRTSLRFSSCNKISSSSHVSFGGRSSPLPQL